MLAQIATLIGVNLSAGIVEVVVFDEGAELRGPVVICACDYLPVAAREQPIGGTAWSGITHITRSPYCGYDYLQARSA